MLSAWLAPAFFALLWLLYIILMLVLEAEGALTLEVANTTTFVARDVLAIASHCLHSGTTFRNTLEFIRARTGQAICVNGRHHTSDIGKAKVPALHVSLMNGFILWWNSLKYSILV